MVTGNSGKARELKQLLKLDQLRFDFRSLEADEIQSMDLSAVGNHKTVQAMELLEDRAEWDAVLTDDTGLFLEGLSGLPGPMVKWFLERLGAGGIYRLLDGKQKKATAVCALSLGLLREKKVVSFTAEVEGEIVDPKGMDGFGFDPVFQPLGSEKTFSMMSLDEKNRHSHRALAVEKLHDWIINGQG